MMVAMFFNQLMSSWRMFLVTTWISLNICSRYERYSLIYCMVVEWKSGKDD